MYSEIIIIVYKKQNDTKSIVIFNTLKARIYIFVDDAIFATSVEDDVVDMDFSESSVC